MKKLRKELIKRKTTLAKASKERVKVMIAKTQNHLRKQQDTIVYPPIKPYYCVPGCNFLWEASGKFH